MNNYDYDTWSSDVNDFFLLSLCLSFERKEKKETEKKRKGKKSEITPKFERNAKQLRNIELNAKHP